MIPVQVPLTFFLLVCRSAVLEPTTVNFPSLCVSESLPVKIQSLEANFPTEFLHLCNGFIKLTPEPNSHQIIFMS